MIDKLRLKHFPISYFSMTLGLAGFTIAFQSAEQILHLPGHLSYFIQLFSTAVFFILLTTYIIKLIFHPDAVITEFQHPIKLVFFPTISISFLLLSAAFLGQNMILSKYLWIIGTTLHFLFVLKVVSTWMHDSKFEVKHMNPAWFIPAVGNMVVPLAGIQHFSAEVSWFFFSVGFLFWVILLIIFFNRIFFHHPIPQKLLPTLFILIAPPVIGFMSYTKLTGEINEFGKVLYYIGLFFTILLLTQIKMFSKIKFYLSWWAYSFPMAAVTIASILMYHHTELVGFKYISYFFLVILIALIALLLVRTAFAIFRKEVCIEEKD